MPGIKIKTADVEQRGDGLDAQAYKDIFGKNFDAMRAAFTAMSDEDRQAQCA